ncbi:hypothetical protein NC653_030898 [Populus alba x Populus x berolinensis]|uniref:Uncharacterized protein n=1 Tax=Populus alba x Populus x berolinensis TaxID=444605 RepID=A0AAD6LX19_9ROSI|nr:hypothetical protein NC653_030898 [Populus alba x Populus x berolinensis]
MNRGFLLLLLLLQPVKKQDCFHTCISKACLC